MAERYESAARRYGNLKTGLREQPPALTSGTIVWSNNAYPSANNFSAWNGQQEVSADRVTIIAPPAEVGGGPKGRSALGRFRVDATDADPFGNASAQRAEVLTSITALGGRMCQGSDVWMAWETFFGDPADVSESNVFRASAGTDWNFFTQIHSSGGTLTPPVGFSVDARSGSSPSVWRFQAVCRGGPGTSPTSIVKHDLGAFEYGWHEFRVYLKFGQSGVGRLQLWLDNSERVDYTGPVGYNPALDGGVCNYLKQGVYRGRTSTNSTVYLAGTRMNTGSDI